jgi:hypothetical protein
MSLADYMHVNDDHCDHDNNDDHRNHDNDDDNDDHDNNDHNDDHDTYTSGTVTPTFRCSQESLPYTLDIYKNSSQNLPIDLSHLPNILDRYGVAIIRFENYYTPQQLVAATITAYESSIIFTDLTNGNLLPVASSYAANTAEKVLFITILPINNNINYDMVSSAFWKNICQDWPQNLKIVILAYKNTSDSI